MVRGIVEGVEFTFIVSDTRGREAVVMDEADEEFIFGRRVFGFGNGGFTFEPGLFGFIFRVDIHTHFISPFSSSACAPLVYYTQNSGR
jgi:hypothetical protein